MLPNFLGLTVFCIMVIAGDFQGSPTKVFKAIMAILNQKFLDRTTHTINIGIATKFPMMQTHDLNIGLPWPHLSHKKPPRTVDETPQITMIREYKRAKTGR